MPKQAKRSRLYNLELEDLLKARKPYSHLELAEICDRLGDRLEAERWREADRQERNE